MAVTWVIRHGVSSSLSHGMSELTSCNYHWQRHIGGNPHVTDGNDSNDNFILYSSQCKRSVTYTHTKGQQTVSPWLTLSHLIAQHTGPLENGSDDQDMAWCYFASSSAQEKNIMLGLWLYDLPTK